MEKDNRETVYDEKIFPLMEQIIEVCREAKIAFLANFLIGGSEAEDAEKEPLYCTSALLDDDYNPTESQLAALRQLRRSGHLMAFTVSTSPT